MFIFIMVIRSDTQILTSLNKGSCSHWNEWHNLKESQYEKDYDYVQWGQIWLDTAFQEFSGCR